MYLFFNKIGRPIFSSSEYQPVSDESGSAIAVNDNEMPFNADEVVSAQSHYYDFGKGEVFAVPVRPSHLHDFDWASGEWVVDLERAKRERWGDAKLDRKDALASGFSYDGVAFDSDPGSQQQIQGAVLMARTAMDAGEPFSVEWTLADNTNVPLDAPTMVGVGKAMAAHVSRCHKAGRIARERINAAETVDEILAVDYHAILEGL